MPRYRGEDNYPPIYLSIYLSIYQVPRGGHHRVLYCTVLYCTVLCRYRGEDITVHEFAHSLHLLGLTFVFPSFEQELQALYDEAR